MPHRPPAHQPARPAGRAHDARPSAHQRGYGVGWRKLRASFLMRHPLCQADGCTEAATDVDHVLAREKGGTDDEANLMALCHGCHSRKTCRVDGGLGNPRSEA